MAPGARPRAGALRGAREEVRAAFPRAPPYVRRARARGADRADATDARWRQTSHDRDLSAVQQKKAVAGRHRSLAL